MTLAEMQEYVANLAEKPWWREIFPSSLPIHVVDSGYLSDDGSAVSYTQPDAYPRPAKYTISMHPRMLTNRILIHELAHCVTPSLTGDPESVRSGEDLADRTKPHGAPAHYMSELARNRSRHMQAIKSTTPLSARRGRRWPHGARR
ncbi:MAG: hypothetical protein QM662_07490 [Gordonia sp. (in: high G+C Gram-positive bacteria)]